MQPTHLIADTICRTVELGLTITNAAIDERFTWIDCQPVEHDTRCRRCGEPGRLRDHVIRVLTDLPITGHPVRLRVRVPRFTCNNDECAVTIYRQSLPAAADDSASTTRRVTRWILQRLALDKMSISAVAKALGIGWDLTKDLALSAVKDLVYDQPEHLGDVRYLGVDEHKWKHCRGQGAASFVTVIVDLTPVIDGTGRARLLDMVPGRSAAALETWLGEQEPNFRSRIQRIALDGFAGYHRAAADAIPQARTVMDPFHVVHLAAEKMNLCRQRVQQETTGQHEVKGPVLVQSQLSVGSINSLATSSV